MHGLRDRAWGHIDHAIHAAEKAHNEWLKDMGKQLPDRARSPDRLKCAVHNRIRVPHFNRQCRKFRRIPDDGT
jgi:hypothetical protein